MVRWSHDGVSGGRFWRIFPVYIMSCGKMNLLYIKQHPLEFEPGVSTNDIIVKSKMAEV